MPYKENLKRASSLKTELDGYRPLTAEMENRIMQKFRLDWNYHSSHIEGNQLTFGETKALILFGQTAQAKPLKDHLEMTGHNEAIKLLEDIIHQERPLTEAFIRELHKLILKEPYEVNAITPDGKPTKRTIAIGQYKTVPNHVKTSTGEMFYFATPEETPAKMGDLMQWYNENLNNSQIHPVLFATEFHYKFICIHPFDDGNGRMARLLMNFILMQKGYPPAIVKTEDKINYFAALRQADAGQIEFFFNYICEQTIRSLEIMIKGAKGESIDEPDDLDKKLQLLLQEINYEDENNEIKEHLTIEAVQNAMQNWGYTLMEQLVKTTAKFNAFYSSPKHNVSLSLDSSGPWVEFKDDLDYLPIIRTIEEFPSDRQLSKAEVRFQCNYGAYIKGGLHPFNCNYSIEIKFEKYHYEVLVPPLNEEVPWGNTSYCKKLLHQALTPNDLEQINTQWGELLLTHLVTNREKLKTNDASSIEDRQK